MEPLELEEALHAVGELLAAEQTEAAIVVVGGAALSLLGLVRRTTRDIDVIARAAIPIAGASESRIPLQLQSPDPLPESLTRAIQTVARDFGLPANWMNTDVALQWRAGLPPTLTDDLTWRQYANLRVGLVGRPGLIALKLFAAVDDGPKGVHFQDLKALHPTQAELDEAAAWVRTQDASPVFVDMVEAVIRAVRVRPDEQTEGPATP